MPYQIKACAGKPYRPSSGTEGMDFMYRFCERCKHDEEYQMDPSAKGCQIIVMSMACEIDDPDYPKEWTHNEDGEPMCAAFKAKE